MKNICLKKSFICGIIVLLIGSGVVSAFYGNPSNNSKPMNSGNWLYVGGSGPGNYSTIQSAIDAANSGDTIFVYNKIYYENVFIGKNNIRLIGEDKNTTIIDASNGAGNGIFIYNCDYINISHFTIRNAQPSAGGPIPQGNGVYILAYSMSKSGETANDNSLFDCIICNNSNCGVHIHAYDIDAFANNNLILHCEISNNGLSGVYFDVGGWEGGGSYFINNKILSSKISNNGIYQGPTESWGCRTGITLKIKGVITQTLISNCNLFGNHDCGISIIKSSGIQTGGENNTIIHNNFCNITNNAYDEFNNSWYNETIQEGNYWSDYTGVDTNNDGIGDSPYNIAGGSNQDLYPFMNPNGWLNNPPFTPHDPIPSDNATNISVNTLLQWIGGDPDTDDNVTYDVYLGSTLPLPKVSDNQSKPWYKTGTPSYNTNYYWKIVAWDSHGLSTSGPIWRFTTCIGPVNHPPNIPSNPSPPNQATSVDIDAALSWTGGDPDAGDFVFYDVYFGSMPPLEKIASNITAKSYNPGPLAYSLTYFWKVVAWDIHGLSTVGPVWYFTTMNATNNPPNKPSKPSGVTNGKVGQEYSYTTSTTDPDGDQMYYLWDWGDGNNSGWLGPYNSGVTAGVTHNWTIKGSYSVKVKAKDIYGKESGWSDSLPITMPYTYKPILQFLEWLFERFPHAFPILRHLLERQRL